MDTKLPWDRVVASIVFVATGFWVGSMPYMLHDCERERLKRELEERREATDIAEKLRRNGFTVVERGR